MKLVNQSYEILNIINGNEELKLIEKIARTCYKSEDKITEDLSSAEKIIKMLLKNEHTAMIEHSFLSVKFITDRAVTHEIVRHRLFSFAQESQRYVSYAKEKNGAEVTFINPENTYVMDRSLVDNYELRTKLKDMTLESYMEAEKTYLDLVNSGVKPQIARAVLPNGTKTEISVSGNYREWRHFFKLRCAKDAHPTMRALVTPLLDEVHERIPIIFDDLYEEFYPDFKENTTKNMSDMVIDNYKHSIQGDENEK